MENLILQTNRSWIEIDKDALHHNVKELSTLIQSPTEIMAVIKADAYGHGAIEIAKELEKDGIHSFAVATIDEAILLRKNNIHGNILILGYTAPILAKHLEKYQLTQTVIDYNYALQLNSMNQHINIHIKIDTGMHRLGENYLDFTHITKLFELDNLHVTGIFSHLCVADSPKQEDILFTKQQFFHFHQIITKLTNHGYNVGKLHMQSSYGLINYPEENFDYVRIGIALYGVHSSQNDYQKYPLHLKPVFSLYSRIACLHNLKKGQTIGYGRNYKLHRDSLIAVIPIGYADGLPRHLANNQEVIVHNQRVPIIGKMCMDQMMIDVTDVDDIKINDLVTIIGKNISVEEIANHAHTISNEILSRMGTRLPKIYK